MNIQKLAALAENVDAADPTFSECRNLAAGATVLLGRVHDLNAWARNRLACCDAALTGRNGEQDAESVARYEQERRTIRAVISILDGDAGP